MKYRYRVGIFLFVLSVITYLDRVCISVAGPRIQEYLRIGPEEWGWVVGSFAIAYAIFEIPGGWMADRFGPRVVLTRIVVWWSAFTALTGTVTSFRSLVLTRFWFGAGEAGAFPNAAVAIGAWFPLKERGRAFGILSVAMQLGGALSPLLVVPIQMRYGWRAAFYIFAVPGILWAIFWFLWFRNSPRETAGVSPEELAETPPSSPARELIPWATVICRQNFWAILFMAFTFSYGSYFFVAWLHTYLVRARHFAEKDLLFSTLPFVFGAFANFLGGIASDFLLTRCGLTAARRWAGMTGLGSAGLFTLLAVFSVSKAATLLFLCLSFGGICFNQVMTFPVSLDVAREFPGSMAGAMNMAAQVGSFCSGVLFGYITRISGSYDRPMFLMAAVLCCGAFSWLRIDPTKPLILTAHSSLGVVVAQQPD